MRTISCVFLLLFISGFTLSQEQWDNTSRGSIPEALLRPARGEEPRYPIDIVIGELGRGEASPQSYSFANSVLRGLLTGEADHPSLSSVNSVMLESYLSALAAVRPVSFRIGGGREEADGSVSFLVRFLGSEQGITGELYIREKRTEKREESEEGTEGEQSEETKLITQVSWVFEDLLLEEAQDREAEQKGSQYLLDFYPYERFY